MITIKEEEQMTKDCALITKKTITTKDGVPVITTTITKTKDGVPANTTTIRTTKKDGVVVQTTTTKDGVLANRTTTTKYGVPTTTTNDEAPEDEVQAKTATKEQGRGDFLDSARLARVLLLTSGSFYFVYKGLDAVSAFINRKN